MIVDYFIFDENSLELQNKAELEKALDERLKLSHTLNQPQVATKKLTLSKIQLPPPPQLNNNDKAQLTDKNAAIQSTDMERTNAFVKQKNAHPQTFTSISSASNNQVKPSAKMVNQQYSQLASLNGANLQLNFPNNPQETSRILHYMHDCIGIGLGAFSNAKQSGESLTILSQAKGDYSAIMRLASGVQTAKEKSLLQAYAPKQQLARLYPKWFDLGLSKKIAIEIGQAKLSQFSGTYQLQGNELSLHNILINKQAVSGEWTLSKIFLCRV